MWLAKYREGGLAALKAKPVLGKPPRRNATRLRRLYTLIAGSDPRQLQVEAALWTRDMVRELIRREFDVRLSAVSVGRLLTKLACPRSGRCGGSGRPTPRPCGAGGTRSSRRSGNGPRPTAPPSTSATRPGSAPTTTPGPPGPGRPDPGGEGHRRPAQREHDLRSDHHGGRAVQRVPWRAHRRGVHRLLQEAAGRPPGRSIWSWPGTRPTRPRPPGTSSPPPAGG